MTGITGLHALLAQLEETLLACLNAERPTGNPEADQPTYNPETVENDYLELSSPPNDQKDLRPLLKSLVDNHVGSRRPLYAYLLNHLDQLQSFLYTDIEIQQQLFLQAPNQHPLFQLSRDLEMKLSTFLYELKDRLARSLTESKTIVFDNHHYIIMGLKPGWLSASPPERDLIKQLFSCCHLEYNNATLTSINTWMHELFREQHVHRLKQLIHQLDKETATINAEIRQLMPSSWRTFEKNAVLSTEQEFVFFQSTSKIQLDTTYLDLADCIQDDALKELYIQYHQYRNKKFYAESKLSQHNASIQRSLSASSSVEASKETAETPLLRQSQQTSLADASEPFILRIARTGWTMSRLAYDTVTSSLAKAIDLDDQNTTSESSPDRNSNELEESYNDFFL